MTTKCLVFILCLVRDSPSLMNKSQAGRAIADFWRSQKLSPFQKNLMTEEKTEPLQIQK